MYGAAASLVLFVSARLIAELVYPMGRYPFPNLLFFLGTPYLALTFLSHETSYIGPLAANAISAIFWVMLGVVLARFIRRVWLAVVVWLLVAVVLIAVLYIFIILAMMSGSP